MLGIERLTDAVAALQATQESNTLAIRDILAAVLQVTQLQAEVALRMTALHEQLLLPKGQEPRVHEPQAGEAFGWVFDPEDLEKPSEVQS